jgi:integrase
MALNNIGMTDKEIADRGLTLHAWRHFCNTELQKAGLSVQKVQAVTGHKSERMTELYTHFDPSQFGEVPNIQAGLLRKEPEEEPANHSDISIVKLQDSEQNTRRKKAS